MSPKHRPDDGGRQIIQDRLAQALTYHQAGRLADAAALYEWVLNRAPNHADCRHLLGVLCHQTGCSERAVALIGEAIALDDAEPSYHNNLGNAHFGLGQLDVAGACYRRALMLKPDYPGAHYNLANLLQSQGFPERAVPHFRQALALWPERADVHNNLGIALLEQGHLTQAMACFERARALDPDHAEAPNNLGKCCQELGRFSEAEVYYRQALTLRPDFRDAHSNLLMTLSYSPGITADRLLAEHREFGRHFCAPVAPHANLRTPERQLRIGYVSGDFRQHVVGYFCEPLLRNHDRERFTIHCYSETRRCDDLTARLKTLASGGWCDTAGLSDTAMADRIRADGIDILVDLAGHTAYNRLPVFAQKPAPVQVSWLGYWETTGLTTFDAILMDAATVSLGAERWFTEPVVRLPHGRFCYVPPAYAPEVAAPPCLSRQAVTFGSFSNIAKINADVLRLWARVLDAVPNSRLLLKWKTLSEAGERARISRTFSDLGGNPGRLELRGFSPHPIMLAEYSDIDIALDPFPFSGGLTTCEALYMGVPVLTLPGERPVSRQTQAFLTEIGLANRLVAGSEDAFIQKAADLAANPDQLADWRLGQRTRMKASPLCAETRFTLDLEAVYRQLWQCWCAK